MAQTVKVVGKVVIGVILTAAGTRVLQRALSN